MLTKYDLLELGFTEHLMRGTGYMSVASMHPPIYYYINNRITINATEIWTWFLDDKQRNDIAVGTKEELKLLLEKNMDYSNPIKSEDGGYYIPKVEFTEDDWASVYTGKCIESTTHSYLVESPKYGTGWIPKENVRIIK